MKIDAIIVLYEPQKELLARNIHSFQKYISDIVLIDNSTTELSQDFLNQFEKVHYHFLHGNKGVAYALKYGINQCIKQNADVILTMDQDSYFKEDTFQYLVQYLETNTSEKLGMISPSICLMGREVPATDEVEEIDCSITSGSMILVNNYLKTQGVNEDLFIDCIDFDLCRQMKELGLQIKRIYSAKLIHELGNSRVRKFFGKTITVSEHSPLRYYYYYRNFYYCKKQSNYAKQYFNKMNKDKRNMFIKMILFEKQRIKKIRFILLGKKDAKRNRIGPYAHGK